MTQCNSYRKLFKKDPKGRSDSLILCDSCLEDFRVKVERISAELQKIERRAKEDDSLCRECALVLEYDDFMKGDRLCSNCRTTQQNSLYLLSSSSEEELKSRLEDLVRGGNRR